MIQVDGSFSQEILGSSDGSSNQRYSLAHSPLIESTLEISVDDGTGPRLWERHDTLLYSQGTDEHSLIQRDAQDTAWIIFGDGKYGRIPRRGRNNLVANYLVGGGIKGNVSANTIIKAVTPIQDLKQVFNSLAASGGAEAETSEEAALRGPNLFRSMGRAVTAQDYENQALEFGVHKVRARAEGWNRIALYVAPAGGGQPTDTLKDDLNAYFEARRILTSIIEIKDPIYVPVAIEGTLEVEAYYFSDQVQQTVQDSVNNLLDFENVDFEDVLYISKVYEAIESITGVQGVNITRFSRPDSTSVLPSDGTLRFGWNEIPLVAYPEGIRLTSVQGGRRAF